MILHLGGGGAICDSSGVGWMNLLAFGKRGMTPNGVNKEKE